MKTRHLAAAILLIGALLAAILISTSCGGGDQLGGVALEMLQEVPGEAVSYS